MFKERPVSRREFIKQAVTEGVKCSAILSFINTLIKKEEAAAGVVLAEKKEEEPAQEEPIKELPPCNEATQLQRKKEGKLYINLNSKEHYVLAKPRSDGEKEILELIDDEETTVEEQWAYIRQEKENTEHWLEQGIEEKKQTGVLRIEWDKWVDEYPKMSEVSFYHNHALTAEDKTMPFRISLSETVSMEDLKTYFGLACGFAKAENVPEKIDFRVMVPSGMFIITPDLSLVDDEGALDEMKDKIWALFQQRLKYIAIKAPYSLDKKKNAELNKKFAEEFSSRLLKMEFQPRKD